MPFAPPSFKFDRDDFGDLPDDVKEAIGFEAGSIPRGPLDPVDIQTVIANLSDAGHPTTSMDAGAAQARTGISVSDVSKAGGQVKVQVSTEEYELYAYDPDLGAFSGVCVGARKAGSGTGGSAQDFQLKIAGETYTVTAFEECGLIDDRAYYVGWNRATDTGIVSSARENAMGTDITFLGEVVAPNDQGGGSGQGGETTSDGTLR